MGRLGVEVLVPEDDPEHSLELVDGDHILNEGLICNVPELGSGAREMVVEMTLGWAELGELDIAHFVPSRCWHGRGVSHGRFTTTTSGGDC